MSSITITKRDITGMRTDCIVNAANSGLQAGGGVCGAIFRAAGHRRLQEACDRIGGCKTGDAVITPGFDLFAKYIIHAVGPVWGGGGNGEPEALYSCYRKSLELAAANGCKSIAFPLISSGIYGYPKEEAWETAIQSCSDYLDLFEDSDIDVYFAVIDDITKAMGEKVLEKMLGDEEDDEEEEGGELIEASFDGDGPYQVGSPEVEKAIGEWFETENEDDLDAALETIFEATQNGLKVIVPVAYDEDGDIMYQLISGEDDDRWMACFTNNAEKVKGEKCSSIVMSMAETMDRAVNIDGCSGIAINPWGDGMFIPKEIVEAMMEELQPKPQDQYDFEAGLEAYARCEYDAAAAILRKSADAGNVNAMARLGLCSYHGRGVDKDPAEAIELWRKAAIFGDICATYMLGDMYRTGQTGEDPAFALQLYQKAFVDACDNPNVWTFPDAALRVLKYNREAYDPDSIKGMASDMVDCYNERMRLGDLTCAADYAQAQQILEDVK